MIFELATELPQESSGLRTLELCMRAHVRWRHEVSALEAAIEVRDIAETRIVGDLCDRPHFVPRGQISINGAEVAVSAVRSGLGIAVASLPAFSEDLDSGALVQLLPGWALGNIGAHALYVAGPAANPAAQAFVDHLVEVLKPLT